MLDDYYAEKKRLDGKGDIFAFGKTNPVEEYYEKMAKLSALPEDERYAKFKSVSDFYFETKAKGDELTSRYLDYDTLFDGLLFKPTSELF